MALDPGNIAAAALAYAGRHPRDILALALKEYAPDLAISFSGAEDVVLVDMAVKLGGTFRVFSLDTGRLHPETYQFIEKVRGHYGIPDRHVLSAAGSRPGARAREGALLLLPGRPQGVLRHPQGRAADARARVARGRGSPASARIRARAPAAMCRSCSSIRRSGRPSGRSSSSTRSARWTSKQVWTYIRDEAVPYNTLHDRGFISIGCEPCTRPVHPGQHEREGRWWWEEETKKECGLHLGNVK